MERVIDKAVVLACCLVGLVALRWELALLVALLCALATSGFAEIMPKRFVALPAFAYALVALVVPVFSAFLPLVAYDLSRDNRSLVRACWILPVLVACVYLPLLSVCVIVLSCGIAFLLSLRTRRSLEETSLYQHLLDDVRETSMLLEDKNLGLRNKQDMEVHLATLAERDRIAREIHDNVGHLLTRSIMQVGALQVVHRADEQVCGELALVGVTLQEAMDTVRESVHDLHDDAFDLEAKIGEAAAACVPLVVDIEYRAEEVPSEVGYCFLAIVREALSNTVKHSDANRASVSVTAYPAFFRLVVHDNGSISPPSEVFERTGSAVKMGEGVLSRRGIGLVTMVDRARALGGRCNISYDQGFRVFVTVLKKEQE